MVARIGRMVARGAPATWAIDDDPGAVGALASMDQPSTKTSAAVSRMAKAALAAAPRFSRERQARDVAAVMQAASDRGEVFEADLQMIRRPNTALFAYPPSASRLPQFAPFLPKTAIARKCVTHDDTRRFLGLGDGN